MPARWKLRSRWRIVTRSYAAVRKNFPKASGPSLRSESLSISNAERRRSAKDDNSGRRKMSGSAAAVMTKPAFRKVQWLARDIDVARRGDGTVVLKSRIPLQPYEKHIPASLAKWAKEAPDRIWLAQRG